MVERLKSIGAMVLRLIVVLAMLACPRLGAAQGAWSVTATSGDALGQVISPIALAVDAAGNLYIAENLVVNNGLGDNVGVRRIHQRDARDTGR